MICSCEAARGNRSECAEEAAPPRIARCTNVYTNRLSGILHTFDLAPASDASGETRNDDCAPCASHAAHGDGAPAVRHAGLRVPASCACRRWPHRRMAEHETRADTRKKNDATRVGARRIACERNRTLILAMLPSAPNGDYDDSQKRQEETFCSHVAHTSLRTIASRAAIVSGA